MYLYALAYGGFIEIYLPRSKFIHGCATLIPERVDLVPFWLPQSMPDFLSTDETN